MEEKPTDYTIIDTSKLDFFQTFNLVLHYMREVLGIQPIKGTAGANHFIGKALGRWAISHLSNQKIEAEICRQLLFGLVTDLEEVRRYNASVFTAFVKKIKKADQYIEGFRFELFMASYFIDAKIPFIYGVPDFTILQSPQNLQIECARVFISPLEKHTSEKLISKILTKIFKDKNGKDYANKNCALFVDISTVIRRSLENKDINFEKICNILKTKKERINYGSVIFFYSFYDISEKKLRFRYQREDTVDIAESLRDFLNGFILLGDFETNSTNEVFLDNY